MQQCIFVRFKLMMWNREKGRRGERNDRGIRVSRSSASSNRSRFSTRQNKVWRNIEREMRWAARDAQASIVIPQLKTWETNTFMLWRTPLSRHNRSLVLRRIVGARISRILSMRLLSSSTVYFLCSFHRISEISEYCNGISRGINLGRRIRRDNILFINVWFMNMQYFTKNSVAFL